MTHVGIDPLPVFVRVLRNPEKYRALRRVGARISFANGNALIPVGWPEASIQWGEPVISDVRGAASGSRRTATQQYRRWTWLRSGRDVAASSLPFEGLASPRQSEKLTGLPHEFPAVFEVASKRFKLTRTVARADSEQQTAVRDGLGYRRVLC